MRVKISGIKNAKKRGESLIPTKTQVTKKGR